MQHEAALGLHRAAEVDRLLGQVLAVERELDLLEQVLQLDVDRLVDHQAERALLGVLAEVDHGAGEVSSAMPGMAIRNWFVRLIESAAMRAFYSPRHTATRRQHVPPAMDKALDRALVWFRRDLRADDHAALYHALRAARQVWCAFVFDRDILDPLPRADRRVEFIRDILVDARRRAARARRGARRDGVGLIVRHGAAARRDRRGWPHALHVQAVFANHDDEPDALARDASVRGALADARHRAAHVARTT